MYGCSSLQRSGKEFGRLHRRENSSSIIRSETVLKRCFSVIKDGFGSVLKIGINLNKTIFLKRK